MSTMSWEQGPQSSLIVAASLAANQVVAGTSSRCLDIGWNSANLMNAGVDAL